MDARVMIGLGVALIALGIVGAVMAGPMILDAESVFADGRTQEGKSMRVKAGIVQYCGAGLGALGVVFMTAGFIKDQQEKLSRF